MKNEFDQRYIDLYVRRRRLMSRDQRKNAADIDQLTIEINALKATGDVSEKAIKYAVYCPWR